LSMYLQEKLEKAHGQICVPAVSCLFTHAFMVMPGAIFSKLWYGFTKQAEIEQAFADGRDAQKQTQLEENIALIESLNLPA